jgi:hypothetical protein
MDYADGVGIEGGLDLDYAAHRVVVDSWCALLG